MTKYRTLLIYDPWNRFRTSSTHRNLRQTIFISVGSSKCKASHDIVVIYSHVKKRLLLIYRYLHEILCLAVLIWYKLTSARGYPSSSTKESSIPTPCCKKLTKVIYVNFIHNHFCCVLALCCMYAKLND